LLRSGHHTAARTVPDRVLGEQAMERRHVPRAKRRVTGPHQLYVLSAPVSPLLTVAPPKRARSRRTLSLAVLAVYRGLPAAIGVSAVLMQRRTDHTGATHKPRQPPDAPRFCRHDGTSCRQEPARPSVVPAGNPPLEAGI
jgi:hypothetical protein